MCIVTYVASRMPLPLVPFLEGTPAFNVTAVTAEEEPVQIHLSLPHVRHAGSHTCCGCGFNEGREYPESCDDPATERAAALESSARLARYVRDHRVEEIYSCWSGDEGEPQEFARVITPEHLVAPEFFFRERELLTISHVIG